jgi:hypothetical protein
VFDDLEGKFHLLAANDEAEIQLPEAAHALETVDEPFDPGVFPGSRELNVEPDFSKLQPRLPMALPVKPAGRPVVKRIRVQVPAVGGIAPGDGIGVVRRYQVKASAVPCYRMDFFHGTHNVADVLDHVDSADFFKGSVAERQGSVEVGEDIRRRCVAVRIHSDGSFSFPVAAAQVKL